MDKSHLLVVICLVVSSMTSVSAEGSTLLWTVSNDTTTCIASFFDDPTEWVQAFKNDPNYGITPELYCLEENPFPIGPLAPNPSVPDVIVTADLEDDKLFLYDVTPEGLAESYFGGAVDVTGIAIDYQSQNIYFTVPTRLVIVQFGRSRPYFTVLLQDRDNARQIVVDPDEGYIFWAESAAIRHASLTGDQLTDITGEVSEDVLLTIDTIDKRIFVLEGNTLNIHDYDGAVTTTYVVPDTLVGITYDQQYIFGTTANYPNILIMNATSGEVMANVSFESDLTHGDITSRLAESKQPTGPCATNNGGCSHICTHVSTNERKCLCGFGFVLQDDGSSCKSEYLTDNFVLATDADLNAIYQIDTDSSSTRGIPIERNNNQFIEAVVYDPLEKTVIWMDTGNGTLRSLALTEDSTEKVIYTFDNDSFISDIAFDNINRVVYYADYDLSEIGRIYLNGTHNVLLSTASQGKPIQIELDIVGGYVYWSSEGETSKILRAQIPDGSGMTTIVETGLVYPSGLALNITDSLIYWVDLDAGKLEKVNVNGSGREILAVTEDQTDLALDNDYLYMSRTHDLSRFALSSKQESSFTMDVFSFVGGISLYSSSISPQPTTQAITTTVRAAATETEAEGTTAAPATASKEWKKTSSPPGIRSGASVVTGLTWPIWGLMWFRHIIG